MKESTKRSPIIEEIIDWWEYLDTGERVAVVWLSLVALVLVVLGIIFPVFGLVALFVAGLIGTIVAIVHLINSSF